MVLSSVNGCDATASNRDPTPSISADAKTVQELGFTLLGLWVLATALSDSFYWLTFVYLMHQADTSWSLMPPESIAGIVATGAELAVGLGLLFGARGILGVVRRFREVGG